jgi:hypothetical protein
MGKPSAPPAPDYAAAAAAQTQGNKDLAAINAGFARPNESTVGGTKTWTLKPGADPKNPLPGDYIVTTQLSPEQQALYDRGTAIGNQALAFGQEKLGQVGEATRNPLDLSGLDITKPLTGVTPQGQVETPGLNTKIDTSGLAAMPTDAAGTRDAVTNAIIARGMPQLDKAAQAARTRSIVAGGDAGSEGYKNTEDANDRARNDFLLASIGAGSDAAQKEIASQLAMRGQGFGERTTEAGFGNDALSKMFGMDLSGGAQAFGQDVTAANLNNANRGTSIQELLMQRSLPLNELNALRTGNQVQMPVFGGAPQTQVPGGPGPFDAAQAQSAYDNAQYGANMSGYNSTLGAGANLVALYAMYAM